MALDVVTGFPALEYLSQIVEGMMEVVYAANNVYVKKESFMELSSYMERVVPILKELKKKDIGNPESLETFIEILNREVNASKQLILDCTKRSKVYIFMNSRTITRRLQNATREISRALSLLPLASLNLSSSLSDEIQKLSDIMQKAEFKAAIAEEDILEKIESGINERNVDRAYANNLLVRIAEAVGVSAEKSTLRQELEEFKSEIENARLRKDHAEAIQMDQIIALLERSDAASSPKEKEIKYLTKRNSIGSQTLEPLQSFYCPITGDVMVDPVETSSGQTFERSAIAKWLADGNKLCPLTLIPLDTNGLRPNKTLRQSIEEWKDRNTMITIASMKSKLANGDVEEMFHCLGQLQDLCEQREQHREWVILEDYIPILIRLLGEKNRDIRKLALLNLSILAKDCDDAKERVARVDNAIESIVKFLGRRVDERKLSVSLLLELSKCNSVRDHIGKAQGCILLLVTMASSDDHQEATNAEELLDYLAFSTRNIVQMAKANYFKHLLLHLSNGSEDVKIVMASTLAEMELTDHNRASLFEGGALGPLLQLISHSDFEMKMAAVKALRNLSSLVENGLRMIREGAIRPLLDLLFCYSSPTSSLREQVAATILHVAVSMMSQESIQPSISLLDSDDDIFKLFSLFSLTGPSVQQYILQTFCALCQSSSASNIKQKLMTAECSAVEVLVLFCQHENSSVRGNALKLLNCLLEDVDEAIIPEHVNLKFIEKLLEIIQSSSDSEEIASAMGIISSLPENPQITQWLWDTSALPLILKVLQSLNDPQTKRLVESAVKSIRQFTVPSNLERQKKAAEIGVIPVLVTLLDSGSTLTKKYAAISLGRFSQNSLRLSKNIRRHKGLWCFSVTPDNVCVAHDGICSVESSFCLVEAEAVKPLVRVLDDPDPEACEASLDALLTLVEAERLQSGCKVFVEANVIPSIVKFLGSSSQILQLKALRALDRIFRLPELKQKYGPSVHLPLIYLTQKGSSNTRSLSAKILAQLNVLHDQSSYF